ncbi:3-isopropylmalate dehydratase small subunit [Pueribacillus theae]|uniref:3-isopropylmalate dehydratase small subunit n=1 Tax=Pueribacillus theae TaxID=2171751 RepID=A0A2U1K403_9BACI|nr:3-isopropylmalate dehydratase small subunit [Pueribacillus theae]PWA12257.1 3-isopropylmalate dehydratase small subunit [Pueribacillus theae]
MKPIKVFKGKVASLDRVNVDTDQIIPKQFLKRIERSGFGEFLFYDWRYKAPGKLNENFELNQPENQGAEILVTGDNFGCGSSREHAPWALLDYGFRVIIAPSFADIFYNNCMKNGILPIRLDDEKVKELMAKKASDADYEVTADLEQQMVYDSSGFQASFDIDPYWREMLLNGWDEIAVTLRHEDEIRAFENSR